MQVRLCDITRNGNDRQSEGIIEMMVFLKFPIYSHFKSLFFSMRHLYIILHRSPEISISGPFFVAHFQPPEKVDACRTYQMERYYRQNKK